MLYIYREVGQVFYIRDVPTTTKHIGVNSAVLEYKGDRHRVEVLDYVQLEGCTVVLKSTGVKTATWGFPDKEIPVKREEIYERPVQR